MSKVDVSVVVPTYCEAANLPILVPRIATALAEAGLRGEILIVDDNSPDATPDTCADLSREFDVRLLVRETERGLSSAVLHGMRHARGEWIVVMDADLSHPPEQIPELLKPLQSEEADFVVGSRYVPGGRTADDWSWFRWLNSKGATLLARPLTSISDPMAGFFALRRATFESARDLNPVGYKIGLELLVKCGCQRVEEVPIFFQNRLHGESKLSLKEQVNYLRHLRRLYEHRFGAWVPRSLFCLIGATGMVIDLTLFSFLLAAAAPLGVARALAILAAMTWNFVFHRGLTFEEAQPAPWWKQYQWFCTSCLFGAAINWTVTVALCRSFDWFDAWKPAAAAVGVIAGTISNYLLCSRVVFARQATSAPDASGDVRSTPRRKRRDLSRSA